MRLLLVAHETSRGIPKKDSAGERQVGRVRTSTSVLGCQHLPRKGTPVAPQAGARIYPRNGNSAIEHRCRKPGRLQNDYRLEELKADVIVRVQPFLRLV